MKVIKILNNNAILAVDEKDIEYVYMAKGIGFQNKINSELIDIEGQKQYKLSTKENQKELTEHIDIKFVELSADILNLVQEKFPNADENILIPLADHIAFTMHRIEKQIEVKNPFVADIKVLFPEEFAIATSARQIIKDKLGILVNDDELGYITMHIHSSITAEHIDLSLQIIALIKDFMAEIEAETGIKINYSSITYTRFVTHIKFMVSRIFNKETITLDMNDYTKENFPYSHEKAEILTTAIEKIIKININKIETGYLALHIERVTSSITER